MGYNDVETYSNTYISNGLNVIENKKIQLDTNEYLKNLYEISLGYEKNAFIGAVINRPIFSKTMLREDIHCFTVKILDNIPGKYLEFLLFVNDRTLFKRFRLFTDDNASVKIDNSVTPQQLIKNLRSNTYNTEFKLTSEELRVIKIIKDLNNINKETKIDGIKPSIKCEIIDVVSYNKHLWEYILYPIYCLGLHNDPESEMYYIDEHPIL